MKMTTRLRYGRSSTGAVDPIGTAGAGRGVQRLAFAIVATVVIASGVGVASVTDVPDAGAAPVVSAPAITVVPGTTGLIDGAVLTVTGQAFDPYGAIAVVQCSIEAATGGPDFCNEHFVSVPIADSTGAFTTGFTVHPVIETAAGTVDCRTTVCVLGAENLGNRGQLAFVGLSFTGGPPAPPVPPVQRAPWVGPGRVRAVATAERPASLVVLAGVAPDLEPGRLGTVVAPIRARVPRVPVTGEGLLRLTMSGPGTAWRDPRDTSVVVEAAVDGEQSQTFVLFEGAQPFTYEGFTGPVTTGRHTVTVRVRADLSETTRWIPTAAVETAELLVVAPDNPAYLALSHAPVLYGRSVNAHSDTPLLAYVDQAPLAGGGTHLSYTTVWSNEDAGTGFVPFLLSGTWGRTTDIETTVSFDLDASGTMANATYSGCSACGPAFPENRTALIETTDLFHGALFGEHPILRVATGNNDLSDQGTTAFRFQQALAASPLPGATREGAMDRNPWTYRIAGQEQRRERADFSTAVASTAPGAVRQYAIVELDVDTAHVASVRVELTLAGDRRTFTNDFGSSYPLYTGGHGRTTVKLPLDELHRRVTSFRLVLLPDGTGTPSATVQEATVTRYGGGRMHDLHPPAPVVALTLS